MRNLIKAERYKLFHNFVYWLFLAAYIVLGFIGIANYETAYSAAEYETIYVHSLSDFFCSMCSDLLLVIVPVSALLALFTGRELYKRNISAMVASGHERLHILISKAIVKIPACFFILIAYPTAGTIRMIPVFGTEKIAYELLLILKTMLEVFVCSSVIFLLAILFAFIIKNGIVAGVANAIVTFILTLMFATFAGFGLNYMNILNPCYYLRDILDPSKGFINIKAMLASLILFSVLYAAIWKLFKRGEIK